MCSNEWIVNQISTFCRTNNDFSRGVSKWGVARYNLLLSFSGIFIELYFWSWYLCRTHIWMLNCSDHVDLTVIPVFEWASSGNRISSWRDWNSEELTGRAFTTVPVRKAANIGTDSTQLIVMLSVRFSPSFEKLCFIREIISSLLLMDRETNVALFVPLKSPLTSCPTVALWPSCSKLAYHILSFFCTLCNKIEAVV